MPRIFDYTDSNLSSSDEPKGRSLLIKKFREFVLLKGQIDDLTSRQNVIKGELTKVLQEEGIEDDKGHLWLDLPYEVGGYRSIQRQRRVSQKLDAERAEELLTDRGLQDRCYKMMPVLDEDEVMACLYEGLLSEEDVDEMFKKTITWAFVPQKRKEA